MDQRRAFGQDGRLHGGSARRRDDRMVASGAVVVKKPQEEGRACGISLYAGDSLQGERKGGANKGDVATALLERPAVFNVVATGAGERGFIKVNFDVPPGVFVSTFRGGARHQSDAQDLDGEDDREVRFLEVRAGMSVVVTPAVGSMEAAQSLVKGGYRLTCWRDPLTGEHLLRVDHAAAWKVEVMPSNQVSTGPVRPVTEGDRRQVAFFSAYLKAAEELLPRDLHEQIRRRAWEIAKGK